MKIKQYTFLLLLFVTAICLSGCFRSQSPFYENEQIVQDDRIVGTYEDRPSESTWWVSRSQDFPGKYQLLLKDDNATAELVGTLFRLNDILYLDIFPIKDSGMRPDPGGPPTTSELVHSILYQPQHLVWKVELSETNFVFWSPSKRGISQALKIAPELKPKSGSMAETLTLQLPDSTKDSQVYLRRFGTNTMIFDNRGQMAKTMKQ
jgi:hypothetical protein